MTIKKETTTGSRRQHHSTPKGSSFSLKNHQDLLKNSALSLPAKVTTRAHKMAANRRQHASKEMVRRALTPPARRLSWRWFDFRPTPSRLSVMSMDV
ncbi:hypothetical protein SSX86_008746 [Deinandra increscens subsp. villosa]|uniref:Uncharacterized protein n=1 Tax=Deinandra increscens subsp. villosa TaxID=3103831 RepID=A0AAP0H2B5_9ASTR